MFFKFITIFFLATCGPLNVANGLVDYSKSAENGGYPVSTTASFSCNSGHYQNGPNSITCQASGNWNEQTPTCEGSFRYSSSLQSR